MDLTAPPRKLNWREVVIASVFFVVALVILLTVAKSCQKPPGTPFTVWKEKVGDYQKLTFWCSCEESPFQHKGLEGTVKDSSLPEKTIVVCQCEQPTDDEAQRLLEKTEEVKKKLLTEEENQPLTATQSVTLASGESIDQDCVVVHGESYCRPFGDLQLGVDEKGDARILRSSAEGFLLAKCLTDKEIRALPKLTTGSSEIIGTQIRVDSKTGVALVKCVKE